MAMLYLFLPGLTNQVELTVLESMPNIKLEQISWPAIFLANSWPGSIMARKPILSRSLFLPPFPTVFMFIDPCRMFVLYLVPGGARRTLGAQFNDNSLITVLPL